MQTFLQDLRFGFRILRRSPGFSILAILCLTLGIGTNAAALSWIEGILIRPYPLVAHQDRMFALNCTTRGAEGFTGLSYPDFLDLEKDSTARSSATRSTSGCRRRCRRRSITPATNSKIGPRAGLKVMLFSNPESRGSKERRNFPRSRNGWRTIIPKRIAATKLGCYHCGKRRSTRQAEFRGRSALQRPSFSLSSSSLAPTSATCFSRDHSYAGTK